MLKIKCKKCEEIIYAQYNSLNMTDKKVLTKLQNKPDNEANLTIYLTCDNNHTEKYYCKVEDKKK